MSEHFEHVVGVISFQHVNGAEHTSAKPRPQERDFVIRSLAQNQLGCAVNQRVMLLPCSKKVLGSIPGQGSFCMEIACSPRACVGSHRVLRLPPTVQRHVC
ncbi:hypothetical protein AMECASPLE_019601 [Ameca splendens]|uniref:Uncharacterized protein n=1 Tax=Ameca splendens TaxID=208324 RepID=A0ABV0YF30_9TELE